MLAIASRTDMDGLLRTGVAVTAAATAGLLIGPFPNRLPVPTAGGVGVGGGAGVPGKNTAGDADGGYCTPDGNTGVATTEGGSSAATGACGTGSALAAAGVVNNAIPAGPPIRVASTTGDMVVYVVVAKAWPPPGLSSVATATYGTWWEGVAMRGPNTLAATSGVAGVPMLAVAGVAGVAAAAAMRRS